MFSSIHPDLRLRKVILTDFRNIEHAEVDFPNGKISDFKEGKSSVLGVYGQNGSGKTSLIMALKALQTALRGSKFDDKDWPSCIRAGCKSTRLEFELSGFSDDGVEYDIYYGFSMTVEHLDGDVEECSSSLNDFMENQGYGRVLTDEGEKVIASFLRPKDIRMVIFDEKLQFAGASKDGKKQNKQVLIDTSDNACKASGKAFGNKTKYEQFTANSDSNIDSFLDRAKIEAAIESKSFIFTSKVRRELFKGTTVLSHKILLQSLVFYGYAHLIIVMMEDASLDNKDYLSLHAWSLLEDGPHSKDITIFLQGQSSVPEEDYILVKNSIKSISKVISTIVPELALEIQDIGKTIARNGKEVHLFELKSNRGGVKIPLAYESAGIIRMISFLMTFVAAYNNPSVTVAIDELDSGIFEYMLGELISIMNESAQGQIVFTSHNLRPLEVLPYKNLLFTTVNPENRFSRLEGISGNNNLRDSYFRSITIGTGKDAYYDATDRFNIEQAIFEAGLPVEE